VASYRCRVQVCAQFLGPPCRKLIPVSETYDGDNFFVVKGSVRMATPLLLALAVIEISDVAFAVDSIPAVLPLHPCLPT
jgi:predicted tellurium resistance membrane protein TerC